MNTILSFMSALAIIGGAIVFLFLIIGGTLWYSDLKNDLRPKWHMLYSDAEREEKQKTMVWIRRRFPWYAVFSFFLFLIGIFGAFLTAKTNTENECNMNGGIFESWDSGFQWKCYNPSEIQQENNFRVILEDE
jgi:hypothetical protein